MQARQVPPDPRAPHRLLPDLRVRQDQPEALARPAQPARPDLMAPRVPRDPREAPAPQDPPERKETSVRPVRRVSRVSKVRRATTAQQDPLEAPDPPAPQVPLDQRGRPVPRAPLDRQDRLAQRDRLDLLARQDRRACRVFRATRDRLDQQAPQAPPARLDLRVQLGRIRPLPGQLDPLAPPARLDPLAQPERLAHLARQDPPGAPREPSRNSPRRPGRPRSPSPTPSGTSTFTETAPSCWGLMSRPPTARASRLVPAFPATSSRPWCTARSALRQALRVRQDQLAQLDPLGRPQRLPDPPDPPDPLALQDLPGQLDPPGLAAPLARLAEPERPGRLELADPPDPPVPE